MTNPPSLTPTIPLWALSSIILWDATGDEGRAKYRCFRPAGKGERSGNDGHQNGHQHSDTTHTTPTPARTERPVIADKLTSGEMSEDRTKRVKANFKTGALNHSATVPSFGEYPQIQVCSSLGRWSPKSSQTLHQAYVGSKSCVSSGPTPPPSTKQPRGFTRHF
jgi:hypothetical protein